jgi:hypothetical protein
MEMIGRLLILGMAVTFFLLAYESTSFMAVAGYVWGSILTLALLASFRTKSRYPEKDGN